MGFYGNIINYLNKATGGFLLKNSNKLITPDSSENVGIQSQDSWINIDGEVNQHTILFSHGGSAPTNSYQPVVNNDQIALPEFAYDAKGHLLSLSSKQISLNSAIKIELVNNIYYLYQGDKLIGTIAPTISDVNNGSTIIGGSVETFTSSSVPTGLEINVPYLKLLYDNIEPLYISLKEVNEVAGGASTETTVEVINNQISVQINDNSIGKNKLVDTYVEQTIFEEKINELENKIAEGGDGTTNNGVSEAYVQQQDQLTLAESKKYSDEKLQEAKDYADTQAKSFTAIDDGNGNITITVI